MVRHSTSRSPVGVAAVALVSALALASCAPETPMPTPTPTETVISTADGVLKIGTLLSRSSASLVAAVELAVRDINLAGGVAGVPVEVFHRTSGAEDTDQLETSFAQLVDKGVDVVIGPSTEEFRNRLAPLARAASILIISPTVTVLETEENDLFLSLSAPLSAQAIALSSGLIDNGASLVTLVAVRDSTSLGEAEARFNGEADALATALDAELDAVGARLALATSFDVSEPDLPRLLAALAKSRAENIIVATPRAGTGAAAGLVGQLVAAGYPGSSLWFTAEATVSYSESLPSGALDGAHGIRGAAESNSDFVRGLNQSDPGLGFEPSAGEAYDAVILAALAALQGGDDGGAAIAKNLREPGSDGILCGSFAECVDILGQNRGVAFVGLTGSRGIAADGSVVAADFALYSFTAKNAPVLQLPTE
jgi:ABC-type branched-subunit amino acid transport system substrate-binding protein